MRTIITSIKIGQKKEQKLKKHLATTWRMKQKFLLMMKLWMFQNITQQTILLILHHLYHMQLDTSHQPLAPRQRPSLTSFRRKEDTSNARTKEEQEGPKKNTEKNKQIDNLNEEAQKNQTLIPTQTWTLT